MIKSFCYEGICKHPSLRTLMDDGMLFLTYLGSVGFMMPNFLFRHASQAISYQNNCHICNFDRHTLDFVLTDYK